MNNRHRKNSKTREQREHTKMLIRSAVAGALTGFAIWVLISWLNIAFNNCDPNPVYQAWNLFDMTLR